MKGSDGRSNLHTRTCSGAHDQYFFFRDRGMVVFEGFIRSQGTNLCLSAGDDGRNRKVFLVDCGNVSDAQWFTLFENGEIVNKYSKYCIDIKGYNGKGRIYTYPCQSLADQMWEYERTTLDGYALKFKSVDSGLCIGIDHKGRIVTQDCQLMDTE